MSPRARTLLSMLREHAKDGVAELRMGKVAAQLDVSVRTAQRTMRELEAAGLVMREPVQPHLDEGVHAFAANRYRLA